METKLEERKHTLMAKVGEMDPKLAKKKKWNKFFCLYKY